MPDSRPLASAAAVAVAVAAAAVVALSVVVFLQVLVWANFWVGVLCLVYSRKNSRLEREKRKTVNSRFQKFFQRDTFKDAPFFLAGPIF